MAKKRSNKCSYKSRYTESWVTPAQYITELICERAAQRKSVDLPRQFWKLEVWKDYFKQQISEANKLVKKFSHQSIVKALLDPRATNIFSLRNPFLLTLISQYKYHELVDVSKRKIIESNEYKDQFHKETIVTKINRIDNGI